MKKLGLVFLLISLFLLLNGCDLVTSPIDEEVPIVPIDPIVTDTNVEPFTRLFNDEIEKSLIITISNAEWTGLNDAMISYAEQFGGDLRTDHYAKADLTYTDDLGRVEIADIGLRTRGNLSRVLVENSDGSLNLSNFKISFDEDFDQADLKANKKRTVFELEELDMKFNRNWDSTYLSEKFSLDLFNEFGVYAATTTLANLYITIGEETHYYGLYTLFEPIDEQFLQRRMTETQAEGNLYKSLWQQFMPASLQYVTYPQEIGMKDVSTNYRPTYDLKTNEKVGDTSDLAAFINQINSLNDLDFVQYIDDYFNVDMFLRQLAVGVLLGNPDDYRAMGNNYYFYHDNLLNIWTMIPYDYDHGLGQGWTGEPVFTDYTIGADIYEWGNLNQVFLNVETYAHPLVDRILNVSKYQVLYENYLALLIDPENHLFSYEQFLSQYNMQKGLYDDMLSDAMMNLNFDLRNIEWYMNGKIADIDNQLTFYALHPEMRGK
ncbi:MAG: CotH kinase family protein [Firmicutes bacterium]|nr:CotH kinase family protein [Bacillota bacterium]